MISTGLIFEISKIFIVKLNWTKPMLHKIFSRQGYPNIKGLIIFICFGVIVALLPIPDFWAGFIVGQSIMIFAKIDKLFQVDKD